MPEWRPACCRRQINQTAPKSRLGGLPENHRNDLDYFSSAISRYSTLESE
jgi:hypothetical protein